MKENELLLIGALAVAGYYLLHHVTKSAATAPAAPGTGTGTLTGSAALDKGLGQAATNLATTAGSELFGGLFGPSNNSASTNSGSGTPVVSQTAGDTTGNAPSAGSDIFSWFN